MLDYLGRYEVSPGCVYRRIRVQAEGVAVKCATQMEKGNNGGALALDLFVSGNVYHSVIFQLENNYKL